MRKLTCLALVTGLLSLAPGEGTGEDPIPTVLVRAHRSSNLNFTANSEATLIFNNEDVDINNNYNPSTGVFTAPSLGYYRIRACVRFSATNFASGDTASVSIENSNGNWAGFNRSLIGSSGGHSCVEDIVYLGMGSTSVIKVNATGSSNQRTVAGSGNYSTYLNIEAVR